MSFMTVHHRVILPTCIIASQVPSGSQTYEISCILKAKNADPLKKY